MVKYGEKDKEWQCAQVCSWIFSNRTYSAHCVSNLSADTGLNFILFKKVSSKTALSEDRISPLLHVLFVYLYRNC